MNAWNRVLETSSVDDPVLREKAEKAFDGARVDQIIVREGHTWATHIIDSYVYSGDTGYLGGSKVYVFIRPHKNDYWFVHTKVIRMNYSRDTSGINLPKLELKGGAEIGSYLVMLYLNYGIDTGSTIADGFGALYGKIIMNDSEVIGASGHLRWEEGIVPRKVRKALGISWWERYEPIKWSAVEDEKNGRLCWKLQYTGGREVQGSLDYVSGRLCGTL